VVLGLERKLPQSGTDEPYRRFFWH